MTQWVAFAEGDYQVESAFLLAPDGMALEIAHAVITIFTDRQGHRQVRGSGMTRPFWITQMHETDDRLDLYLNLGADFIFCMEDPVLQSGKVFSPDVTSAIHFHPTGPWKPVTKDHFNNLRHNARFPADATI